MRKMQMHVIMTKNMQFLYNPISCGNPIQIIFLCNMKILEVSNKHFLFCVFSA